LVILITCALIGALVIRGIFFQEARSVSEEQMKLVDLLSHQSW
jgi:hypothetical protein